MLKMFEDDGYEVTSYDELEEEQKKVIDAFNLSQMLEEALAESEKVDYREVQFILGRLSALRKPELIPTVLQNLERLYPVAEAVAAFFKEFKNLPKEESTKVGEALLTPLLNPLGVPTPVIQQVFGHER